MWSRFAILLPIERQTKYTRRQFDLLGNIVNHPDNFSEVHFRELWKERPWTDK